MAEPMTTLSGLLDVADVARLYRVHEQTVRDWARLGRIPAPVVRQHRFTRWDADEVRAHIKGMREAALQEAAS